MKTIIQHIPDWLKNKYFISSAGFVVWMLFFDQQDIVSTHFKQTAELSRLIESRKFYEQEILATTEQLKLLKTNPETLEKIAREKYRMKKENEDLFIIPLSDPK